MYSVLLECVRFLQNVFSYYRMSCLWLASLPWAAWCSPWCSLESWTPPTVIDKWVSVCVCVWEREREPYVDIYGSGDMYEYICYGICIDTYMAYISICMAYISICMAYVSICMAYVSIYIWHIYRYVWHMYRYIYGIYIDMYGVWHMYRYVWHMYRSSWQVSEWVCVRERERAIFRYIWLRRHVSMYMLWHTYRYIWHIYRYIRQAIFEVRMLHMYVRMYLYMYGCVYACTYACMYVCMLCMYTCMYMHICGRLCFRFEGIACIQCTVSAQNVFSIDVFSIESVL